MLHCGQITESYAGVLFSLESVATILTKLKYVFMKPLPNSGEAFVSGVSNNKSSTASNDKSCIGKESTIASNKRGFEEVDQHGNINLHQGRKSARVSKPNPKYQDVTFMKQADV